MVAALAREHPGLAERAHALLEKERVAGGGGDELSLERQERVVVAEQLPQELLGVLRGQGFDAEVPVVRLAAPRVLVLGPVADDQQEARRGQAVDQGVQQRPRLGVDPVQVLDHDDDRLHLTLPEEEPLHRVERVLAALGQVEGLPVRVMGRHVEQPEQPGEERLQRGVDREQPARDLVGDLGGLVPQLDLEVHAEEVDDGLIGGGLPVGDAAGLQDEPALGPRRVQEFPQEPGLADAGLGENRHDLAVSLAGQRDRRLEVAELARAAHERGQPAGRRRLEPRPHRIGADHLEHLEGRHEPLHRPLAERRHLHVALDEPEGRGRDEDGAGSGHLLHARRDVGRLPDGGVVHAQVARPQADDHLARVHADADLDGARLRRLDGSRRTS